MDKFTEEDKKFISLLKPEWKWVARDWNNDLYLYKTKPTKSEKAWATNSIDNFYRLMFDSYLKNVYSLDWDNLFCNIHREDEEPTRLREPILDDIERTYIKLYVVNNPCFENRKIDGITKIIFNSANGKFCQLSISFYDKNIRRRMLLAPFEKDKMYLGMKLNKTYTIEDLMD